MKRTFCLLCFISFFYMQKQIWNMDVYYYNKLQ